MLILFARITTLPQIQVKFLYLHYLLNMSGYSFTDNYVWLLESWNMELGSHFIYLYDVAGTYVPIFSGSGHDPGYLVHGEYPDLVKSERLRIAYLSPGNISWYRYRRR